MSLPRIFGTSVASIPAEIPYLDVDPVVVERWRRELESIRELKVGIAWQGHPQFRRDRQRSFRLDRFEPIFRRRDVRLFSLQKDYGTEQIAQVANHFAVTDLGSVLADFSDTAAVMKNLDLVIVPDTSLAHLAGALGIPVWVALPFAPDWRWLPGREDSPWYPTLRVFRQPRWGDWDAVFERIATELEARLDRKDSR
jgi:hypothetical protein